VIVIAEENLWLTADKESLVPDGHPDAAFLFSSSGGELSVAEAEKYGLLGGKAKAAQEDAEPEEKKAAKPADKKAAKPADKKHHPSHSKAKK